MKFGFQVESRKGDIMSDKTFEELLSSTDLGELETACSKMLKEQSDHFTKGGGVDQQDRISKIFRRMWDVQGARRPCWKDEG